MPAPFATLQSRVNQAVVSRLATHTATIGGLQVEVMFDREYLAPGLGGSGISSGQPSVRALVADLPAILVGSTAVSVAGGSYVVAEARPDGMGMTRLMLERAS
jgi:hypothetical protein